MKNAFFRTIAGLTGKNLRSTPSSVVRDQLLEPRPLPMGRKEFYEWSARLISGALVPNEDGLRAIHDDEIATKEQKSKLRIFREGQEFALANMLMHLGPTESHKPDAFFIHSLRKFAVNQVADTILREIRDDAKLRLAAEEAAKNKAAKEDEKEEHKPLPPSETTRSVSQPIN